MSAPPSSEPLPAAHPAPHRTWPGYTAALVGAIAFSAKAVVAKLLYRHGVDALAVVALRMLLAWPFFIAMALWGGRGKGRLSAQDLMRVFWLGFFGYYLGAFLDFLGLQYISASLERLILFVYPTVVAMILAARGHQAMPRPQLIALGVSYLGLVFAFGHEAASAMDRPLGQLALGSALVLGGAVAYAFYLVMGADYVRRFGSLRLTGLAISSACAISVGQFCALRPWHAWAEFTPAVWELSILNATLCTVLPIWLTIRALEGVGASATAQIGMFGPVSTMVLAVWLLDERVTPTLVVGTLLVLAGIGLLVRRPTRPVPLDRAT